MKRLTLLLALVVAGCGGTVTPPSQPPAPAVTVPPAPQTGSTAPVSVAYGIFDLSFSCPDGETLFVWDGSAWEQQSQPYVEQNIHTDEALSNPAECK